MKAINMDIYTRIIEDHETHRKLLKDIAATSGDSPERERLFETLKEEVTAHANAEEQSLYAILIENPKSQEQARHSIHEHNEADEYIDELKDTDMSSPGWIATFKKLKESLEHHMDEEEDEVFNMAKDVISQEKAIELTDKFNARKAQEKKVA